jgi:threonine dehydratase
MTGASSLGRGAVEGAATRLAGHVVRTPVLRSPALDEIAGAELWLKAENLQHIGAFKARGAMNAALQLDPEVRARGLVTYSSGNHAQAVALAARRLGVPALITMPLDAPAIKLEAVRALGARVILAGTTSLERRARAIELAEADGAAIIEPFDHPHTIAGQGTATLELQAQVRELGGEPLEALVVPCGGGGLLAGACLAADAAIAIHGVEPVGCDSLGRSLAAGAVVEVAPGPTLADGLKPSRIGELNFEVIKDRIAGALTVTDDELGRALVALLLAAKILVEPSGAAALAAALRGLPGSPRRIGVILSGGNVAPERVADLLKTHPRY